MTLRGKKILLIRLSAMGDVVFNIPLANLLKNGGAKVDWLVSEKGYDIINNNPCVNRAILAPVEKWKKEKNKIKIFFEYLKIIRFIRAQKYDIAIDTQLILKSFIWTKFSGAKRRIVSKSAREGSIFGGNEVIEPIFQDFKLHAIYNYFKFAKYLGINSEKIEMTLPEIPKETANQVEKLLFGLDKNKKNLIIAPATTWENKHWNKENWRKLISSIKNYNIIFVGTKKDLPLIDYISGGKFINLAGKTNLLQLIEVLKRGDILISLDSGTTHLGFLSGVPSIISIFCSTPKERYKPIGKGHIALSGDLKCQPCHKRRCPLKSNACTDFPTPNEVLSALYKIEGAINA